MYDKQKLAAIVNDPIQLLQACLPVVQELKDAKKSPALWGSKEGIPNTGFAELAGEIERVLNLGPGSEKVMASRSGALMLAALFPGLWQSEKDWADFSATLTEDLTGAISRGPGKGSSVLTTALSPLELVIKHDVFGDP
mgnify:CR=1 FL=1